jgi:quercetin dioxygenase-like cupin family protein
MARWTVLRIADMPVVSEGDPEDPVWYPLQHVLGIDAFGVNLFVTEEAGQTLVEDHDERGSGQQELYVILEGEALFHLDGEEVRVEHGTALAVTHPSVRRNAKALTAGTALLIIGAGRTPFASTWNPRHFRDIPRPDSGTSP